MIRTRFRNITPLVVALALFVSACSPNGDPAPPEETPDSFGAAFTPEGALPAAQVAAFPDEHLGRIVQIEGTVTRVCQNRGCWMVLDADEEGEIRVTFRDYGYFVPKDLTAQRVVISGTFQREVLDVDMLRHLAEDAGKSEEEIEAITRPEETLSVVADGVIILRESSPDEST